MTAAVVYLGEHVAKVVGVVAAVMLLLSLLGAALGRDR